MGWGRPGTGYDLRQVYRGQGESDQRERLMRKAELARTIGRRLNAGLICVRGPGSANWRLFGGPPGTPLPGDVESVWFGFWAVASCSVSVGGSRRVMVLVFEAFRQVSALFIVDIGTFAWYNADI
jgi:hypothetical protein